jgi:hypothetical protein
MSQANTRNGSIIGRFPSLEYGRKIGTSDVDPSLDTVHGAMAYKTSLHAIGVERIPPGWLDGPFA